MWIFKLLLGMAFGVSEHASGNSWVVCTFVRRCRKLYIFGFDGESIVQGVITTGLSPNNHDFVFRQANSFTSRCARDDMGDSRI